MAQPRLAHRAPAACAACYQQKPSSPHIDYAAAIEGRLVDPSRPRGNHIDWVVICEKCLRDGVALLPADAKEENRLAEVDQLKRQIAQITERAEDAENYASSLEDAMSHRFAQRSTTEPKPAASAKPKAPGQRRPRYGNAA